MNSILMILIVLIIILIIVLIYFLKNFSLNNTEDLNKFKLEILELISNKNEKSKEDINKNILDFRDKLNEDNTKVIDKIVDFKNKMNLDNYNFNTNMSEKILLLKEEILKDVSVFRESVRTNVSSDVNLLGTKVEERLKEGFKESNETFNKLLERIAKIDEAQKNIEKLSNNVVELQKILSDKKSRGNFGEKQLEQILENIYGHTGVYKRQDVLSNGTKVDASVFLSSISKKLVIDSKFPLENYLRYKEESSFKSEFKKNIEKHIKDISSKYLVEETFNQALMFIPSESIFLDICKDFMEIIEFAQDKNVWICSPTTLMLYISNIKFSEIEFNKNKNAENILKALKTLENEFSTYQVRFEKLEKDLTNIYKDFESINITKRKIFKAFDEIVKL